MSFLRKLLNISKRARLDKYEKEFLDNSPFRSKSASSRHGPVILMQMPMDYFYVSLFSAVTKQLAGTLNAGITGLWPYNINAFDSKKARSSQTLISKSKAQFFNFLDQNKWSKIYLGGGVNSVNKLGNVSLIKSLANFKTATLVWSALKSKRQLVDLELNDLYCGDLIYDTYIRFRAKPTVDLADPYLRYLIWQCLNAQSSMRHLLSERDVKVFISSYSSYVQHGVPVREALLAGIEVYTAGTHAQYLKRLTKDNYLHVPDYWNYSEMFSRLDDQDDKRDLARGLIAKRFAGEIDTATFYMQSSAYKNNNTQLPKGVEGVVFLHDFFDSPHCYRSMLFEDYWEWATYTIKTIRDFGLKFAVKPHPNQIPESIDAVNQLKRAFPEVMWLAPEISNKTIFESGIACGISVCGTILHELAYHGIAAIAAGDHPHISFNIAHTPATIEEYRDMLTNYSTLSNYEEAHSSVLAFYYMHNLHDKEPITTPATTLKLRNLDRHSSRSLVEYLELIKQDA